MPRKNKTERRKASIQNRKSRRRKAEKSYSKNKIALAIIILAAFAVSAFNITGFVASSRTVAFITLSDKLQGSEQTLYNQMSKTGVVTIMPLSAIPEDLSGYQIMAVSKQAGDVFTDDQRALCKKITEFKKPMLLFSGQFATVCRITVGSSMAPPLEWSIINSAYYPTAPYSRTVTPYTFSGNLPAVSQSDQMVRLIKRTDSDAYLAVFLQDPRKAFFSVPDSSFTFTAQGKDLLERTLVWLEKDYIF